MDDPVKKEFPHNIFKPKQNWEFIDKWFDDYGHTLEPREIARWAYCNGRWKHIKIGEAEIKQMLDDIEYYQNRVEELEKTLPLNPQEIIQILKEHKWNVEDKESLADLIDLIRAVEKAHGVV